MRTGITASLVDKAGEGATGCQAPVLAGKLRLRHLRHPPGGGEVGQGVL